MQNTTSLPGIIDNLEPQDNLSFRALLDNIIRKRSIAPEDTATTLRIRQKSTQSNERPNAKAKTPLLGRVSSVTQLSSTYRKGLFPFKAPVRPRHSPLDDTNTDTVASTKMPGKLNKTNKIWTVGNEALLLSISKNDKGAIQLDSSG